MEIIQQIAVKAVEEIFESIRPAFWLNLESDIF